MNGNMMNTGCGRMTAHGNNSSCGCGRAESRSNNSSCGCGRAESRRRGASCGCNRMEMRSNGSSCGCGRNTMRNSGSSCGCREMKSSREDSRCCNEDRNRSSDNMFCDCDMMEQSQHLMDMCQEDLLLWLSQVSFAMFDVSLYLNTHPTDGCAINYFRTMKKMRKAAMDIYVRKFGPLGLDTAGDGCEWDWGMAPLPWE